MPPAPEFHTMTGTLGPMSMQPPASQQFQTMMPPASGQFGGPPQAGVPYAVAAQQVAQRLDTALQRRHGLLRDLDVLTDGEYAREVHKTFSASRKAGLDDVDWRVPRVIYAKDPKFNEGLDPRFAFELQQRKLSDGQLLEQQLAGEADAAWLRDHGMPFAQSEFHVQREPVPFVEAVPSYKSEMDVWSQKLELRTLDEALRGDVSKPMPRPPVFAEDYQNYREGRYVKDDCPIA